MDSTVVAALIGVGGTAIVGVAGYVTNTWNIRKTIIHDRESKVWEQRAAVYIEALAAVNYRQVSRNALVAGAGSEARRIAPALNTTYQQPDWHKLEARMQAFSSEPVMTAMQASSNGHMNALAIYEHQVEHPHPVLRDEDDTEAKAELDKVRIAADKADDAVIEAIRTELQGRGKPLGDWHPFPESDQP